MKHKEYLYAVIRVDCFHGEEVDIQDKISIKEILPTEEEAISECERLNKLNNGKGVKYFWLLSRFYPDGCH